jgi:hypothetical protein
MKASFNEERATGLTSGGSSMVNDGCFLALKPMADTKVLNFKGALRMVSRAEGFSEVERRRSLSVCAFSSAFLEERDHQFWCRGERPDMARKGKEIAGNDRLWVNANTVQWPVHRNNYLSEEMDRDVLPQTTRHEH